MSAGRSGPRDGQGVAQASGAEQPQSPHQPAPLLACTISSTAGSCGSPEVMGCRWQRTRTSAPLPELPPAARHVSIESARLASAALAYTSAALAPSGLLQPPAGRVGQRSRVPASGGTSAGRAPGDRALVGDVGAAPPVAAAAGGDAGAAPPPPFAPAGSSSTTTSVRCWKSVPDLTTGTPVPCTPPWKPSTEDERPGLALWARAPLHRAASGRGAGSCWVHAQQAGEPSTAYSTAHACQDDLGAGRGNVPCTHLAGHEEAVMVMPARQGGPMAGQVHELVEHGLAPHDNASRADHLSAQPLHSTHTCSSSWALR